ncbi:MAG: hypothetical protein ABIT76_08665 [Chthoniobacterales bacterium]
MKIPSLALLSLASLVFGRPASHCTANAATEPDPAALQKQIDAQAKELEALRKAPKVTPEVQTLLDKQAKEIEALRKATAVDPKIQEQLDEQAALIASLRAEKAAPKPEIEETSAIALMIKGAGVKAEDVNWRIRAGLDPAQAVEVALAEKLEADKAAVAKKGK